MNRKGTIMKGKALQEAALGLPPDERASLARTLLLSLGERPEAELTETWLSEAERRAREIVERLQAAGAAVTWEDVALQTGAAAPTRAHVGRAVVACGAASDINEAFRRYLSRGCPAFVGKEPTPPKIVFDHVHAAGGVVCLAHPGRMHGEDEVRRWVSEGLDGVEVVHPANPPAVRSRMNALAGELGLLRCGGSDWHGPDTGRRGVPGWAHVPMRWLEEIGRRSCREADRQPA